PRQGLQPVSAARGGGSRRRDRPRGNRSGGYAGDLQRRRDRVRDRALRPPGADRPRRLELAATPSARQACGARAARARAHARLAARRVALQDGAQRLLRRCLARATRPRVATTTLEPRRPDRDVRLVPREPRARRCGGRDPPRSVEPASSPAAQEAVVVVLSPAGGGEAVDLDALLRALASGAPEASGGE